VIRKIWKSKMTSATMTAATKSALRLLLEQEARRLGSKTLAYDEVARSIGASTSWIRKYLTYDDRVAEPRVSLFQSISKAYETICRRVEQEQQIERAKLAAIRNDINAVTESFDRMVVRETTTQASRTTTSSLT
jgi:hypothetical protein